MMRYQIVDLSIDGRLAMLVDADEHVHVVRFPGCGLDRGERLDGRRAKAGAHVLVVHGHCVAMNVRFEAVDCTQQVALTLMHPVDKGSRGTLADPPSRGTSARHEPA